MALFPWRNLDFEEYDGGSLEPCWKYGCSRLKTLKIRDDEIATVDVVACCEKIISLIEENNVTREETNLLTTRSRLRVSFKDIVRLTYGVLGVYIHQVNILLRETKNLLALIKGTKLVLKLTTRKSVEVRRPNVSSRNRNRKRVITNNSTVIVQKRARFSQPDFLGEAACEYYANMLSEFQIQQVENPQQLPQELEETIQTPRMCEISTTYHAITITEEFEIQNDETFLLPLDGFGETNKDLSFFEELYQERRNSPLKRASTPLDSTDILPHKTNKDLSFLEELHQEPRNSPLKRASTPVDSTDILPHKMLRLDSNLEEMQNSSSDNTIIAKTSSNSIETDKETNAICEPPTPEMIYALPLAIGSKRSKKSKKGRLIIDKSIEYSRSLLLKHRKKYIDDCQARTIVVDFKKISADNLLSRLSKNPIFLDISKNNKISLSEYEMEDANEATLRSIFPEDFSSDLVKKIFGQDSINQVQPYLPLKPQDSHINELNNNYLEKEPLNLISPTTEKPNNNKGLKTPTNCQDNNIQPHLPVKPEDSHLNELNNNNLEQELLNLISPTTEEQNNNNKGVKTPINCQDNNISELQIMMDLLKIWKNNPDIKEVDAMEFMKTFPNRLQAALAFSHLLCLIRNKFITISKKPNSIEMDKIVLGEKSSELIGNSVR